VQAVLQRLSVQPCPLYVAVLMKDVVTWRSSHEVVASSLPKTVGAAFNALFNSLEQSLGVAFVSHALIYVTIAHKGLSEVSLRSTASFVQLSSSVVGSPLLGLQGGPEMAYSLWHHNILQPYVTESCVFRKMS